MEQLKILQDLFESLPPEQALVKAAALFPGRTRLSTSLGQEDQVLTDMIARQGADVNIFTIDTGRLFNETYDTIEKTRARYRLGINVFFPQAEAVQEMVNVGGVNLFYDSIASRQACCNVRKVEPLNRALEGAAIWITGLRASQNDHRKNLRQVEWLEDREMYKINPLLYWSYEDVMNYIRQYSVPYNTLHDQGFVSIGCAPCTRAIAEGEDPRAGRWWWENSHKECGLHLVK